MNLLLDECLPRKLKGSIPDHSVKTVPEMGWAGIHNGELLPLIEGNFDVFITKHDTIPRPKDAWRYAT